MKSKTILIAAGGTGGHFYPALALAKELKNHGWESVFLLTGKIPAHARLDQEKISYRMIEGQGFTRRLSWKLVTALWALVKGFFQVRKIFSELHPALVVGMGSYASFAAVVYASWKGIPTMIHESNVTPGLANSILGKFATKVAVGFPETVQRFGASKAAATGTPVREEILGKEQTVSRQKLGLKPDIFTVLVFGGSQGAHSINRAVTEAITLLPPSWKGKLQFFHITGSQDSERIKDFYSQAKIPGQVVLYCEDMGAAYAASDLVISRSGASTASELIAVQKPALLIPYPHAAGGHQQDNARALERLGAAVVLLEKDLSAKSLSDLLTSLAGNLEKLSAMAKAYQSVSVPVHTSVQHLARLAFETAQNSKFKNC